MNFKELGLIEPLLQAVQTEGYTTPTPIQELAIPHVLTGKDVLGCAQTGTGKTAAFALPMLQNLNSAQPRGKRHIRALILAPTRELASQIGDSFAVYGKNLNLRHSIVFGGVNQNPQTKLLRQGVDILVATPGRLLDLMNQGFIDLSRVEIFVLDEADRMLDMGFIPDIKRVVKELPVKRQTLLFSATLDKTILGLAAGLLNDPVSVSVTPSATTVESIEQFIYFVSKAKKLDLLMHLFAHRGISRALIFSRTKWGTEKLARYLNRAKISAEAIHGDKSQNKRERALKAFKNGQVDVLVATDIAARGLDIDQVSHVINYDLPNEPDAYVHRIGRTGRAGNDGIAFSFCSSEERPLLAAIERTIRTRIPVENEDNPFHSVSAEQADTTPPSKAKKRAAAAAKTFGGGRKSGIPGSGTDPRKGSFRSRPKGGMKRSSQRSSSSGR